jgi:hypothetical protein
VSHLKGWRANRAPPHPIGSYAYDRRNVQKLQLHGRQRRVTGTLLAM